MTKQKNKGGDIEKWDQTESPEIPDMGETSETPGIPLRRRAELNLTHTKS